MKENEWIQHIHPPRSTYLFPLPLVIPCGAIVYPTLEEGGSKRRGKGNRNRMDELMAVNVSIYWTSSEAVLRMCVRVWESGWMGGWVREREREQMGVSFFFLKHLLSLWTACFLLTWRVLFRGFHLAAIITDIWVKYIWALSWTREEMEGSVCVCAWESF